MNTKKDRLIDIFVVISLQMFENCSCLSCTMSLEGALLILLLDGSNNSDDDYLRLHRKVAPYKISFALHFQGNLHHYTRYLLSMTQLFKHLLKIYITGVSQLFILLQNQAMK